MRTSNGKLDFEKLNLHQTTWIIAIFSMLTTTIEFTLHVNDKNNKFAYQNLFFLAYASTFFIFIMFGKFRNVQIEQFKLVLGNFSVKGWLAIIIQFTIMTGVIGGLDAIISQFQPPQKMTIAPWEVYLFYINAAITEEIFYRMFLMTVTTKVIDTFWKTKKSTVGAKKVVGLIMAIVVSSFMFMISHYLVYGSSILLMLSALYAGVTWSVGFVIWKNALPGILSHITINAIVAGVAVQALKCIICIA